MNNSTRTFAAFASPPIITMGIKLPSLINSGYQMQDLLSFSTVKLGLRTFFCLTIFEHAKKTIAQWLDSSEFGDSFYYDYPALLHPILGAVSAGITSSLTCPNILHKSMMLGGLMGEVVGLTLQLLTYEQPTFTLISSDFDGENIESNVYPQMCLLKTELSGLSHPQDLICEIEN